MLLDQVENWEVVQQYCAELDPDQVEYLVLSERHSSGSEVQVERVPMGTSQAEERREHLEVSFDRLRQTAIDNSLPGRATSYRVSAFGPKGGRLGSRCIQVSKGDPLAAYGAPRSEGQPPDVRSELAELMSATTRFLSGGLGILLNAMGTMFTSQGAQVRQLSNQVNDGLAREYELVGTVLNVKSVESSEREHTARAREARQLVDGFLGRVESMGSMYLMKEGELAGIDPALIATLRQAAADPKLRAVFGDARLQALLGNPESREVFASYLANVLSNVTLDPTPESPDGSA